MNGATELNALVVEAARGWLGTPYVHQASARHAGCDCLGLVRGVWREAVGAEPQELPAYTADWGETGAREIVLDFARRHMTVVGPDEEIAGDLLVFRWRPHTVAKHMGILCAPDRFIHAWENCGVCEVHLAPAWRRRIAGVYRFPLHGGAV